jgi:hypothetical protein
MAPLGATYLASPDAAIAALAAAGAYTKPGVSIMQMLLTQRPELLRSLGLGAESAIPMLSRAGAPLMLNFAHEQ